MKNTSIIRTLLIVTLFITSFSDINAQVNEWSVPMGGNAGRNGLSQYLGPLVEQGGEPELYWSGGEYAKYAGLPAIEDDKLVVYRRWSSAAQTESWIVCYNVYDGTELWKVTLPLDPDADHYGKLSGVNNGQVYATRAGGFSEPSALIALDIETGDVLWQSEDKVTEYSFETVSFCENGDIIAGNYDDILCISKDDGTTLWTLDRHSWSSDGSSVACHGNKGYYWDIAPGTIDMVVSVCDLETGELLYFSDPIYTSSMIIQQSGLLVGNDGTIYAPRSNYDSINNTIVSLTDKGDHLQENWRRQIGFVTFCSHGVGPDNTVYTYSWDEQVIRLDPVTGEVLNTSIVVTDDGNPEDSFYPWIAIGDDGMVYLAIEDWPLHKLYFFTPELELLWSEEIYGLRGLALGDSVLAVNAKGTDIRAYKGRPNPGVGITEMPETNNGLYIYPNPSNDVFNIAFKEGVQSADARIDVINVVGQVVYSEQITTATQTHLSVDISDQNDGLYVVRYFANKKYHFQKIVKQ
ncbi:MAG: T9SS type A sorting domain-containing protein [Bacteroidota bacterium]